jgi:hypothetical protein
MAKKQDHDFHMVPMSTFNSNGQVLSPKSTMRQRGLLDASPTFNNSNYASNSPFQFSSTTKHWRWWNYATAFIAIVASIEIILLIVSVILLMFASEPVTFSKNIVFLYLWHKNLIIVHCSYSKLSQNSLSTTRYYHTDQFGSR